MVWLIYKDFDSSIRAVTPVGFQVRLSKILGIFQTCPHPTKGLLGVKRTKETWGIWIWKFIALIFGQNWRNYEILPKSGHSNELPKNFKCS